MRAYLLSAFLAPAIGYASGECIEGDALKSLPKEQREVAEALRTQWLSSVVFCDFGVYQVLTAKDPKADVIYVFRSGKPFLMHEPGFGVNLLQAGPDGKVMSLVTVQPDPTTGKLSRLDYLVRDSSGKAIANVRDKKMDGHVEVLNYQERREPAK